MGGNGATVLWTTGLQHTQRAQHRACITKGPIQSRAALVVLSGGTLPKSQTLADPWPGCSDKLIPAMYEQTILMATPPTPPQSPHKRSCICRAVGPTVLPGWICVNVVASQEGRVDWLVTETEGIGQQDLLNFSSHQSPGQTCKEGTGGASAVPRAASSLTSIPSPHWVCAWVGCGQRGPVPPHTRGTLSKPENQMKKEYCTHAVHPHPKRSHPYLRVPTRVAYLRVG